MQAIVCLLSMLLVSLPGNALQLVSWLVLPRRWSRMVSNAVYLCQGWTMLFFCDYLTNLELVYYGDELPEGESAIVISNHLGAEFVHFAQIAYRYGMIAGARFVQKSPLKYIPINWTCYFHEDVFVKRGEGADARLQATKMMGGLLASLTEDLLPSWLILFPEGTWVGGPAENFLVERSQKFSKKMGLPVLDRVLAPRAAGFTAAIEGAVAARQGALDRAWQSGMSKEGSISPCVTRALYDFTFAYDDPIHPVELGKAMPPSVLHVIGGMKSGSKTPRKLHVYVKRVPLDPTEKNHDPLLMSEPGTYLQKSFEVKEKMLEEFSKKSAAGEAAELFPGRRFEPANTSFGAESSLMPMMMRLSICLSIVAGSWYALWTLSAYLLGGYLSLVIGLSSVVAINVSWNEGEALPPSVNAGN